MIKKLYLIFLLCAGSLFASANSEGYELNIRIKNLANREIILGHHFAGKFYADDTLKLDNAGLGILKGEKKYPEGMYFLLTPRNVLLDFFLTGNQKFSIETDTLNLFENLKFRNSPENQSMLDYQKLIVGKQKEVAELLKKREEVKDENQIKSINIQLEKIALEFKTEANKFIAEQNDNFVGTFIKATQDIEIPQPPKDENGRIVDSLFQYRYYRNHYFDNFEISDARLLRTPIYEEKILKYIEKVIPQHTDTINAECDKILARAEKNSEVFRYMLITLFNHYAKSLIMGFDAVYVHLAENWYVPKATFSDTTFIQTTRENIARMKPMLLGKTAPDLHMLWLPEEHFIEAETDSLIRTNPHLGTFIDLSKQENKYTILAFWECDCSHCKKSIPELYEVYQRLKPKGVGVFSVHMLGGIEGKEKWIKFVNEHKLYDWKNVWNPYDFSYKKVYNIITTPVLFVLDKDKKIIAKRLEPKQIEEFLNDVMRLEEKKQQKLATP
jgi:thiol-disulfide isomerase/thioredoxin